jgi:beta-1,2-mannobiose phosphorylase / 1,2-beta-oligomannan phosphorylase
MPSVLYNEDSLRYEMWFGTSSGVSVSRPFQIGYSFSYDKINWSTPIPVLTPTTGSWDSFTIEYPCVIRENGVYKMWYSGGSVFNPEKIGYATSPDGIEWRKNENPVFEEGIDPWENDGVMAAFIMPAGNKYKMWYTGYTWSGRGKFSIGFAESPDGITWQRDVNNNPVLEPGASGQWDSLWIYSPRVLFINNQYYMWYGGDNGTIRQLGLATSSNGITNWEKDTSNPVLSPSPEKWDASNTHCGSIIFEDNTLYMWYNGNGPGGTFPMQIGLATSRFVPLDVNDISGAFDTYLLEQNYPNPFNPSTTIGYGIKERSNVKITVLNLIGEEVETILNEEKNPGYHTVEFNAGMLPTGIYFYKISAGKYTAVKKMLLIK